MRKNFKVSFYLPSNYENKEGKSPVMLRVFLDEEMVNFGTTKIFVKNIIRQTKCPKNGATTPHFSDVSFLGLRVKYVPAGCNNTL